MEIRQIQYVLMVAETGSFTEAAEALYISQSSISKQIMALEKELGVQLMDRSRRRIVLTRAGEAFLKHADALNASYLAMMAELSAYRTAPSLSILSIPVVAQYGITAHLAQFRNAYPHLDVTLQEREPEAIFRALANYSYDLAFVRDHYLDTELYASLVIARDRLIVAVSKDHRLAGRTSVSLDELAGENFVTYDQSTRVDQLVLDACRQAGFEPRIVYASLRIESILGQVASSSGVALVMEQVFNHSKHLNVVGISLDETIKSNIVLAWRKNKRFSPATKAFVDFMGMQSPDDTGFERPDPAFDCRPPS